MSDESINKNFHLKKREEISLEKYVAGILSGDISLLSAAITLIESANPKHRELAEQIIEECLPHSGKSIRIGITGVPGVGKSTFIESFGSFLTTQERKVAVLAIDPSGRGKDETAYAVVKMFNGNCFLTDSGGLVGGYTDKTLQGLADIAKKEQVKLILVEENYGGGMFTKLLMPFIQRTHPVTIEEIRHSTSKEQRILDVLEPLMQQHRLIVNHSVVLNDYTST